METANISYEQIFSPVKQLPKQQKIRLATELEKECVEIKLSSLPEAFHTDELSLEVIDEEVEMVRGSIYERERFANQGDI